MEATRGMSKSAKQIYEMIILASRDNGTLWPHDIIARDFRGAIAIAVQRSNAMRDAVWQSDELPLVQQHKNAMCLSVCSIQCGIVWYLTFVCIDLCIEL